MEKQQSLSVWHILRQDSFLMNDYCIDSIIQISDFYIGEHTESTLKMGHTQTAQHAYTERGIFNFAIKISV